MRNFRKKKFAKESQCLGKKPFHSQTDAVAVIIRMKKRNKLVQKVCSYKCKYCGKWHIGGHTRS